ncbi:hypothetical protein [Clostridium merdae]|uniref:hypothetical protein n=1 Tax=Clostridium merdae TaxID=1958780 RepID=UPI000A26A54C|nr:hypothetical protein [Clostridium merdae]
MAMGYDGSININTKIDSAGFNQGIKGISNGLDGITASLKNLLRLSVSPLVLPQLLILASLR